MSHELEIGADGEANMIWAGEKPPWHNRGRRVKNPRNSRECMKQAGLDWTVSLHPMYCKLPLPGDPDNVYQAETRMVIRNSDGRRLSEVGRKWTPLQNEEAFTWFDPFLESGEATIETAGSLYEGQRVWVMAKLNRDPMRIVGDDVIDKYLLLSNAHSAVRAARVALTPVRVVCKNTEAMAFSDKETSFLSVRHSKNIKDAMEKVRSIINAADGRFEATAEQYRALTRIGCNEAQLRKYVELVFPTKKDEEEEETTPESDKRKYTVDENDPRKMVNKILPLFEVGRGAQMKGVRGTMWGAYNAITEHLNWERGRTDDARLDQLWYGTGLAASKRALTEALKMV